MLQWSKTHAVDRAANLHENAFILVVPVLRCSKMNFNIIQSRREFIPNARREAGQFGVYYDVTHYYEYYLNALLHIQLPI